MSVMPTTLCMRPAGLATPCRSTGQAPDHDPELALNSIQGQALERKEGRVCPLSS